MSTYRTAIEDLLRDIAKVNDTAKWLRDKASLEEKKYWNNTRMAMFDAEKQLNELNESLSTDRANKELS
jgi:hypothetical protein